MKYLKYLKMFGTVLRRIIAVALVMVGALAMLAGALMVLTIVGAIPGIALAIGGGVLCFVGAIIWSPEIIEKEQEAARRGIKVYVTNREADEN